ncbi:DNA-binding transcriptional regulator, LysR family [Halolactibacillus alkaliphilus]|nr:DNA-binding transcriptional regulator, LysR family [Halolactibacillus alkaliphilus]
MTYTLRPEGEDRMLDYRYRTFLVLADQLNYTKAAKLLALSQPAVTKHIQYLEEHLEVKLFHYEDRVLKLTKKGAFLKNQLTILNREITEILDTLSEHEDVPSFMIGVSRTIGEYYIPEHTCLFCEEKRVKIHLMVENSERLLQLLKDGKIDYALLSGPVNSDDLTAVSFYEDDVILTCSPRHHLANSTVSINDLKHERLLLREEGAGLSEAIDHQLKQDKKALHKLMRINRIGNIQLLKNYIKNDDGIGFLYHISILHELKSGELSTIQLTDFKVTQSFYLVYKNQSKSPKEVECMLDIFSPADTVECDDIPHSVEITNA